LLAACESNGMNTTVDSTLTEAMATVAKGTKLVAFSNRRLNHEWKTMEAMMRIHCRDHHGASNALCAECQGLLNYANLRLDRCRFGEDKLTCAKCPVHCYQKTRREQIRVMMRYAGPRMLWEHPIMSLRHWLDGFRKTQQKLTNVV
jgi:Nitrous oxide-stimulated promoter